MKLCPNLSFRCFTLSSSVFLKVCKGVDLQLVYSVSPFPAFLTYFFQKKMVYPCTSNQASNNNNDPVNSFRRIFKALYFRVFTELTEIPN